MNAALQRAFDLLMADNPPDVTDDDMLVARNMLLRLATFDCATMIFEPGDTYEVRWQPDHGEVLGDLYWYTKYSNGHITSSMDDVRNELTAMWNLAAQVYEYELGDYPAAVVEAYRHGDNFTNVIGRIATWLENFDNLGYFAVIRFGDTVVTIVNRNRGWIVQGMVAPVIAPVVSATFAEALNVYHGQCRLLQPIGDDWISEATKQIKRLQRNYDRRAAKKAAV